MKPPNGHDIIKTVKFQNYFIWLKPIFDNHQLGKVKNAYNIELYLEFSRGDV